MSLVMETLERMTTYVRESKRRTVPHVVGFIAREFNSAVNSSAEVNSVETEEGYKPGNVIMVTVEDPTHETGVRTFKVTVEEWDI